MTSRRPQDPRTKKIRDDDGDVPTIGPDPGETVMPAVDEQRGIETVDPGATVMPADLEAPRPKATRGGAARTMAPASDPNRTITAEGIQAMRDEVRGKAAAAGGAKKRASWLVWVLAFLVLGGIGFAVAWLVMNPPGGGATVAAGAEDPAAGEDAAASAEDGAAAGEDAAAAASAETAAETSDAAAAGAETAADGGAVAAASDAGPDADDVAVAASETSAETVGEVAVAAASDAASDAVGAEAGMIAAGADTALAETTAADGVLVAAAPDAVAPLVDATALAETAAPATPDTQVAAPDAAAVVAKVPIKNPIEATRLNEDGLAARKKGDHAAALKLYEMALGADPDHVWARYNYACELALARRSKEALAELTKLHKLGTADAKRALQAARRDSDFESIKKSGQFFRLTNF